MQSKTCLEDGTPTTDIEQPTCMACGGASWSGSHAEDERVVTTGLVHAGVINECGFVESAIFTAPTASHEDVVHVDSDGRVTTKLGKSIVEHDPAENVTQAKFYVDDELRLHVQATTDLLNAAGLAVGQELTDDEVAAAMKAFEAFIDSAEAKRLEATPPPLTALMPATLEVTMGVDAFADDPETAAELEEAGVKNSDIIGIDVVEEAAIALNTGGANKTDAPVPKSSSVSRAKRTTPKE